MTASSGSSRISSSNGTPAAVWELPTADLRWPVGLLLAGALTLPALPGHPGLPCPLRTLTGVPCPLCGMTTSVEATAHGHLGGALAANPAGPLVVLAAVVVLVLRPATLRAPVGVVVSALIVMWMFELLRFGLI